MEPTLQVFTAPPAWLARLLEAHLPYSLPLLRRLQAAAKLPGAITEHARIFFVSADVSGAAADSAALGAAEGDKPTTAATDAARFAAAYLDLSRGPETELWLYATLEDAAPWAVPGFENPKLTNRRGGEERDDADDDDDDLDATLLRVLMGAVRAASRSHVPPAHRPRAFPGMAMAGTLHARTKEVLRGSGVGVRFAETATVEEEAVVGGEERWDYVKWLFRADELPEVEVEGVAREGSKAGEGMHWGEATREDIKVVLSRTSIPRQERTMVLLPSMVLKAADGTPISWGFLGLDGSLSSLHCEKDYRKRGLAKAVATKIFREQNGRFGPDGLCSADVAPGNVSSQALCRSLNGKPAWANSWSLILLEEEQPVPN